MEEKQELNNILLEQDNLNQSGTKKYLLIGAGLVLLFLVILAIMRAINSDDTKESVLPPEPSIISKKNKTLFQKVEIKDENSGDDEFEQIVKDIKAKASVAEKELSNEAVVDVPKSNVVLQNKDIPKPTPPTKSAKPAKAKTQTVAKPKAKLQNSAQKGTYIQVGAFAKLKPDTKLIKKITSKGYSYIIFDTKINGRNLKKLLIGPYKNRTTAKKDLPSIKSAINKGAFLIRVK